MSLTLLRLIILLLDKYYNIYVHVYALMIFYSKKKKLYIYIYMTVDAKVSHLADKNVVKRIHLNAYYSTGN